MAICDKVNCPISEEKTEWAEESIVFLGMLLNGRQCTISLPIEKLIKALHLIRKFIERKKAKIIEIQKLAGLLNFFHQAIVPGRPFTRRMYDAIKVQDPLKNHHHVTLKRGFTADCKVWEKFLTIAMTDKTLLCRPFVDMETFIHAEQLNFASNASANENFGMGAIFRRKWLVTAWGRDFIRSQKPSIEFLELYALVASILTWSKYLTNCRIIVKCDNQAVIQMVNNLTLRCQQCMKLIRLLTLDGIITNRRVFVQYTESKKNCLPDALSRMQMTRFWRLAPKDMKPLPDTIHTDIWLIEKVWFNNNL